MLLHEYRSAFSFIKQQRGWFIGVAVGFFSVSLLSGIICYLAFSQDPALLEKLMRWVDSLLGSKEIVDASGQMDAVRLFFANFMAVGYSILLGLIPFLYLTVMTLLLNAWLIGVVGSAALLLGMSPAALAASLVPHGIFELPALILGAALGLRLCHSLVRRIFRRSEPGFLTFMTDLMRVLVLVIVPLLILAAVVESYITGPIASLFL